MSERFIFNKRLNRRPHWLLSMLLVSATLFFAFKALAQEQPVLVNPVQLEQKVAPNKLLDIDFRRSSDGGARVILAFANSDVTPEFEVGTNQLTIKLDRVEISEEQLYQLDVTDFATLVEQIETFSGEDGSSVVLSTSSDFGYVDQKSGNSLVIELLAQQQPQQIAEETQGFSGDPISLDFQDVPVRQVLQIIAQLNGFNLVTTDSVSGNVTVSLNGVPWDQALNMIMKIKGLDKRQEGNIWLIAPAEELVARETQELQSKQQVQELAPLRSVNLQINYAKAADIATILKSGEGGILSPRGSVTVDERTNTVLLRDTQGSIDQAREMIEALDIPVRQVLIESRMVTVLDNMDEQLGVRLGFSDLQDDTAVSGSIEGADAIAGGVVPALANRLNVNLPVSNQSAARLGVQVARLMDGTILDLELSALEVENKGEIIASPRITVANQHEAYIEQGTEIPFVQAAASGATSVTFQKAVLSLRVTPHITPDGRIILDLVVTQDTRGETVPTPTGDAVAIDTQEISTQVLVENGETIVLGGIFQQNKSDTVNQVPLLGDLPLLGNLFRNRVNINQKRELLIFVTPKILTEAL